MATTTNKQRMLNQVLAQVRKAPEAPAPRGVLEEVIFAICRDGATTEQAETAFQKLKGAFFDWNEVRVSSYREIEDALDLLPGAEEKAHRILLFLQEVFEIHVCFDLDKLLKEGLKQAVKKLLRFKAASDFVCAWVSQRSLAGHAIPLDAPALRCGQRLGLIEDSFADVESVRASLEHHVPKTKGWGFTEALSLLANEHCEENPRCDSCPLTRDCPTSGALATAGTPVATSRRKPK